MEHVEKLAVLLENLSVREIKISDLDVISTDKPFAMDRAYILNNIGISRMYLRNMTINSESEYVEYRTLEPKTEFVKLAETILNTYNSLKSKSAIFMIDELKVVEVKVNY